MILITNYRRSHSLIKPVLLDALKSMEQAEGSDCDHIKYIHS